MNFTLTTLGTASAMPVVGRNQSAQVLQVHGRLFLIDCGEGVQQQIRKARLSFVRIEAVFISHIHGDHVFGLFGLLSTMGMYGRKTVLPVYGPQALGGMIKFFMSYYGSELGFPVEFREVKCSGLSGIHQSKYLKVSAFPLQHKIETYGYRFDAVPGPKTPADAHLPSYAYASDTRPFPELPSFVKGVDVLYHESTYYQELADKANGRYHSTAAEAARCASQAGVGSLLLGHYTSRCHDLNVFRDEARQIFERSFAAKDTEVFEIPYLVQP